MKPTMNVYYAPGGGMGHFMRALAFIHSHPGLTYRSTVIMVANRSQYQLHQTGFTEPALQNLQVVKIPLQVFENVKLLSEWIKNWVEKYRPAQIFLDTFPAGIMGEWNQVTGAFSRHYVGRYLDMNQYAYPTNIPFSSVYPLEHWHAKQHQVKDGAEVKSILLTYPPARICREAERKLNPAPARPLWLVIHSEPVEEVRLLVKQAQEEARLEGANPEVRICSQQDMPGYPGFRAVPSYPFFHRASRIYSGCGFNTCQQIKSYQGQWRAIPFPRRFDDQALRLIRFRSQQLMNQGTPIP